MPIVMFNTKKMGYLGQLQRLSAMTNLKRKENTYEAKKARK